ncbi:uncharacterized protein LOC134209844 [Armigeres subalbatus]|uniref:uncharacterized protein LOC134209844 n=1 Tax=Armigeres subalbatus TaxID=124917 RepID=UPI002ECFCD48
MEILKEKTKPKEKIMKELVYILCDCLKAQYGYHPSNFYKNQIALSLVRSYPALAADSSDTPQALWFHPHARGTNRHAGRIHYRMEYLSRTNKDRVTRPRMLAQQEAVHDTKQENLSMIDLVEAEGELRFIVPSPQTKSHAMNLWDITFELRQKYRSEEDFYTFAKDCPVSSAYNGEFITLDFYKLKPSANPFLDSWNAMEKNIILKNSELYKELKNAIIRLKNPSRGSKRVRDEEASRHNPLKGIVQWINAEDDYPSNDDQNSAPIMYVRGPMLESSDECAIVWGCIVFPLNLDFKSAFAILVQTFYVFNVTPTPCDKQFYLFITGAVMGVEKLSTTGCKFLHALA